RDKGAEEAVVEERVGHKGMRHERVGHERPRDNRAASDLTDRNTTTVEAAVIGEGRGWREREAERQVHGRDERRLPHALPPHPTAKVQEEVAAGFPLGEVECWQGRSAEVAAGAPAAGCTPAETLARAGSGCPWRTCTACRSCRSGAAQIGLRPRHCSRPRPSLRR